jgi:RNA polymerase sigma-70 factor, ECF subfamily
MAPDRPVPERRQRMPDAKEAEQIDRAQKGDRGAFGALVRAHQRRVFACALQMLGDAGEAEDSTQETFLRAWRAIARFDRRSELSTWLYRICVNVCLNALRRRRRVDAQDIADPRVPEPAADPTQGQTDPRGSAEAAQAYRKLAHALDGLSPSLRATVVLVCIEGVPHKEAAAALGCPEGTIAWRIHEARRRLREALGDLVGEDDEPLAAVAGAAAARREP